MARNIPVATVTLAAVLAFSAPTRPAQDAHAQPPDSSTASERIASIYACAGKLAALRGLLFQGTQRLSVWQANPDNPTQGQWRDCPEVGHFTIALDGVPYTRANITFSPLVHPALSVICVPLGQGPLARRGIRTLKTVAAVSDSTATSPRCARATSLTM